MIKKLFSTNWERSLLLQFFQPDPTKRTAYICSPLRANTPDQFLINLFAARAYMFYAKEYMGFLARAPHAYLPLILSDDSNDERQLALRFGDELLKRSDILFVCGNRISMGMKGEIIQAAVYQKRVFVFDPGLHHEVSQIVRSTSPLLNVVEHLQGHPVLAHPRPHIADHETAVVNAGTGIGLNDRRYDCKSDSSCKALHGFRGRIPCSTKTEGAGSLYSIERSRHIDMSIQEADLPSQRCSSE